MTQNPSSPASSKPTPPEQGAPSSIPAEAVEQLSRLLIKPMVEAKIAETNAKKEVQTKHLDVMREDSKRRWWFYTFVVLVVGGLAFALIRAGNPELASSLMEKTLIFAAGVAAGFGLSHLRRGGGS